MSRHTHTHTNTNTHTYIHTHTYQHTHTHTHTDKLTHTHTNTHTYTNIHRYTKTRILTYTYTQREKTKISSFSRRCKKKSKKNTRCFSCPCKRAGWVATLSQSPVKKAGTRLINGRQWNITEGGGRERSPGVGGGRVRVQCTSLVGWLFAKVSTTLRREQIFFCSRVAVGRIG